MTPLETLKKELLTIAHLRGATSVLHWDQETYMPKNSGDARAEQISLLESMAHEKFTGEGVRGALSELVDLDSGKVNNDLPTDQQRLIEEIWKDFHRASALPKQFVEDLARTTAHAQQIWVKAKNEKDFNIFAPILEKVIELKFKEIKYLGKKDTNYDTLLDEFEPGMTSKEVTRLFEAVKDRLVPLVQKIAQSETDTEQKILFQEYDEQKQWDFGLMILKDMGYDLAQGRQDRSAHPFTINFHPSDVRITTRIKPNDLMAGLSSTIHEGGHGLYEQGLDASWFGTPFSQAISYGIHESQSRLWENLVALSKPFWAHYYPKLQEIFPNKLGDVPLEKFYRAINTVKPSLIRVEADEATYNLHIMLRFEVEKMIINDRLPVAELPELWDTKMEEYLGIRPSNDALGVLQDVHWSFGGFGYFPTYTLGNLYNVPILNKAKTEIADYEKKIASGELLELREWLRKNVHSIGRRKTASELIFDLTGETLSAAPFMDYLEEKYNAIYSL
jgi:carboxypeptidase Taq